MRGLSASPERRCRSSLRLLAAVAAEIFLQEIDHRPEMAAFLDIDLEHVAHVVERRRGLAEMALLLDRGRLGVALDDDQPAQHGAVFARHLLPDRLAQVLAERNLPALFLRREQDAPAVFRHLHVVELGPALRIDRDGGAQIDQRLLKAFRPHGLPPVDVARMPAFERAQDGAILGQADIVGDLGRVIDVLNVHGTLFSDSRHPSKGYRRRRSPLAGTARVLGSAHTRLVSNAGFWPVP